MSRIPVVLEERDARLFLALLNGEEPQLTRILEGGDPFKSFLARYGYVEQEFDALVCLLKQRIQDAPP